MTDYFALRLKRETALKLYNHKKLGESWDDLLLRLIPLSEVENETPASESGAAGIGPAAPTRSPEPRGSTKKTETRKPKK